MDKLVATTPGKEGFKKEEGRIFGLGVLGAGGKAKEGEKKRKRKGKRKRRGGRDVKEWDGAIRFDWQIPNQGGRGEGGRRVVVTKRNKTERIWDLSDS